MSVVQMAGVAVLAAMAALLLRELRTGVAPAVRLAATVFFFGAALLLYTPVVSRLQTLLSLVEGRTLATPLLRALGVALVTELSATLCRDLGESTIAEGVLLFGRLEILVLALPMIDELIKIAGELLR